MRTHVIRDSHCELTVSQLCLGTMYFGTIVDERTSFGLLDRFVEAGGSFVDTANCYASWVDGMDGTESEALLGRWLRSRDAYRQVRVATKIGAARARRDQPYSVHNREGLSPETLCSKAEASRQRLGVETIDLLYAHADDRATPLDAVVAGFGQLVRDGLVGTVGASNYPTWRLALARELAKRQRLPPFCAIQQHYTYLEPSPARTVGAATPQLPVTGELLDYLGTQPDLTLLAYSPLLRGAYSCADRPVPRKPIDYAHRGTPARLATMRTVAQELDVPVNQVVLAWLIGGTPSAIPVIGVSSIGQLVECLEATELVLDPDVRHRLDLAGGG